MTDERQLYAEAHAALDMLQYILYMDVTNEDAVRGVELVSHAPLFEGDNDER
jgi:hypothetical protein